MCSQTSADICFTAYGNLAFPFNVFFTRYNMLDYLSLSPQEHYRKQSVLRKEVSAFDEKAVEAEKGFLRKFNAMFPRKKVQKTVVKKTSK